MLVAMHRPCHASHVSGLTTSRTTITEIFFSVSQELARSHDFLIANLKTLAEKLLAVRPEKGTRKKKN